MRIKIATLVGLVVLGTTAVACSSTPTETSTAAETPAAAESAGLPPTTAVDSSEPQASAAGPAISFVVGGTPEDVTVTGCVNDGGSQTFTMTGSGGLVVELAFFPPALYGQSQTLEQFDTDVTWPGAPAVATVTGSQSQNEDSATVSMEGTFADDTAFSLEFTCDVA